MSNTEDNMLRRMNYRRLKVILNLLFHLDHSLQHACTHTHRELEEVIMLCEVTELKEIQRAPDKSSGNKFWLKQSSILSSRVVRLP